MSPAEILASYSIYGARRPQMSKTAPAKDPRLSENRTELVDTAELAKRLSVGKSTIYKLMAEEGLPSITVGRARRYDVEKVIAWLAARSKP